MVRVDKEFGLKHCNFYIDFGNEHSYPGNGTSLYDLTATGYYQTNTIIGNPTIESGHISFTGTAGQYVDCPQTGTLVSEMSIGGWIRPNSITINLPTTYRGGESPPAIGTQNWVYYPDYNVNYTTIGISVGTNGVVVCERGNGSYIASLLSYSGTISNTDYTHVMVKFVKSGVVYSPVLYINGIQVATGINSFSASYSLSSISIGGGLKNTYGSYFTGDIAILYSFKKAFTDLMFQCMHASHKYRFE